MLVRSAILDEDLSALKKIFNRLTETKVTGEMDVSAVIIGLLVEGGDVLQMNEIADLLERMLNACSGTDSGGNIFAIVTTANVCTLHPVSH